MAKVKKVNLPPVTNNVSSAVTTALLGLVSQFLTSNGFPDLATQIKKKSQRSVTDTDSKVKLEDIYSEWQKSHPQESVAGSVLAKPTTSADIEMAGDDSSDSDSSEDADSESSDSDEESEEDSEDEEEVSAKTAAKINKAAAKVPLPESDDGSSVVSSSSEEESDSSSDQESDDSSEDRKPATVIPVVAATTTAIKKNLKRSAPSSSESSSEEPDSDEDSDSDSAVKPVVKKQKTANAAIPISKAADKTIAKAAAADRGESNSSSDSSSESDEEDAEMKDASTTSSSNADASSAQAESDSDSKSESSELESSSESDDSSDSDAATKTPKKAKSTKTERTGSTDSSATIQGSETAHTPAAVNGIADTATATTSGKKTNVPFSRIANDQYVDPRFSSNRYVSYSYADKAHEDLIVTKGKGFTKEKNKKKRGAYKGGLIDFQPRGIKFDD